MDTVVKDTEKASKRKPTAETGWHEAHRSERSRRQRAKREPKAAQKISQIFGKGQGEHIGQKTELTTIGGGEAAICVGQTGRGDHGVPAEPCIPWTSR